MIDPHRVASVALDLFWEHGFETVTLSHIAEMAGVSRSTLRRSFPTKTDLLWDRSEEEYADLRSALNAAPPDEDAMDIIQREIPKMLHYEDDELGILRRQTLIIAGQERADGTLPARLAKMREILESFFENRWGAPSRDLADIAASTVTVAAWRAIVQWAHSSDTRPVDHQRRALAALAQGFSRRSS